MRVCMCMDACVRACVRTYVCVHGSGCATCGCEVRVYMRRLRGSLYFIYFYLILIGFYGARRVGRGGRGRT